jgi:hypothetical protein
MLDVNGLVNLEVMLGEPFCLALKTNNSNPREQISVDKSMDSMAFSKLNVEKVDNSVRFMQKPKIF